MTDIDKAIAAAREAVDRIKAIPNAGMTNAEHALAHLLAALDAARGEAVAWHSPRVASFNFYDSFSPIEQRSDGWLPVYAAPPAAVPEGYALVKLPAEERDGFWSFSDNEENFVGEECDTELDAIAAAFDYYGDDLETVYVGQAKWIDKARLVRGDHIIELIGEAAGEEVGECAYDWPRISKDECAELERIVMGYVLSKSSAGFFSVENSREYTREQAEEMLAAALAGNKENNSD